MRRLTPVLAGLAAALAPPAGAALVVTPQPGPGVVLVAADPAQSAAALLDRARMWQSRERPDLARQTLDKLFRVSPDNADGLAELALLETRSSHPEAARAPLDKLRKLHPGHPGIARVEVLLRLAGEDKGKLAEARQLAQQARLAGHRDQLPQALAAYRALFGGQAPDGDLALEYWQLYAETDNSWGTVHNGLSKLVKDYPDNLRYRYYLAEHETTKPPLNRRALRVIVEMTKLPEFNRQARAAWRRAMLRLEENEASLSLLDEYLAAESNDSVVAEYRQKVAAAVETQRRLLADPNYRAKLEGLAQLDAGNLEAAEPRLRLAAENRPRDADAWGGMGLLRLRQGRHAEAQAFFRKAFSIDQEKKWQGLETTARFWGLLRQADEAIAAADFRGAEARLDEARAIDAKQSMVALTLAKLRREQGRNDEAERLYRDVLAAEPVSRSALSGLLDLLLAGNRRPEAEALIAGLSAAQRKALGNALNELQAGLLRADADKLAAAGKAAEAIAALEQARGLDPNDPWLVYDLARLYVKGGQPERGAAAFASLLAAHPDDPTALYAQALFESGAERETQALATLERVPPAGRSAKLTALQRRLWQQVQTDRALALGRAGRVDDAWRLMGEVEQVASNFEQALPLARAWNTLGEAARGRALLQRQLGERATAGQQLDYADYLFRAGFADAVPDQLALIAAREGLGDAERRRFAELRLDYELARAGKLDKAGKPEAALQVVAALPPQQPRPRQVLLLEGRLLRQLGRFAEAEQDYRAVLAAAPEDDDGIEGLIRSLLEAGRRDEAIGEARFRLEGAGDRVARRLMLADLLLDLNEEALAGNAILDLRAQGVAGPEGARLLALAGQLARREDRQAEAATLMQQSLALEMANRAVARLPELSRLVVDPAGAELPQLVLARPGPEALSRDGRYRTLAQMLDAATPWAGAALDIRNRPGTDGISSFEAAEIPVEYKTAWEGDRQQVWRADLVRVDAGPLDLAQTRDARTFGSTLLCQSGPLPCLSGVHQQQASGGGLDWAVQGRDWRFDIGSTPLGFPVVNLIGGWLQKGDLGPLSYSLDISRRPISSSLLSYAGARDPRSGQTWGGVVASGVRFGLSWDKGGEFGAWSSLSAHRLTGRNVEDNSRVQLMGGAYWRLINEEDRLLSVGLTRMNWHFAKDSGEYTFGHGGYYSPQSYQSLSLPITYGERYTRWSWLARGAMSVSSSRFDAAPYYPTDQALQAAAQGLGSGVDPNYSASSARGHGYSLHGAWEYQVDPSNFVGGRLEIERSESYTPNRFLLYWRQSIEAAAASPVNMPPEPMLPTSQY